jgi:hypothetical protein
MSATAARATRLAIVLWAGSLWALALWVAPVVFHVLDDRHRAGLVAAQLFRIEAYLTLAVAALAAVRFGPRRSRPIQAACAVLLLNEWLVSPIIGRAAREGSVLGADFAVWHGVSGILYVLACLAALLAVWQNDF